MRRPIHAMLFASGSLAVLMMAVPAIAQTSDDATQASDSSTTRPRGSSVSADEIVVTARRREESIQTVPVSVQAFSGELLARQNVQSTQDLQRLTPEIGRAHV